MTLKRPPINPAQFDTDRSVSYPAPALLKYQIHNPDHFLCRRMFDLVMESDINNAPWRDPQHVKAQYRPDLSPSIPLIQRVSSLLSSSLALDIKAFFTCLNE